MTDRAHAEPYPVLPDSVYVWRGYRSPAKTYELFAQFLGGVFVPACALLQPPVGLRAYLPAMVPPAGRSSALPDQTALMFWATPQAHDLANKAINPIEHFEVPHLALWKSSVAEVLAKHAGDRSNGAGIDTAHPMMQATDRYCRALQANQPIDRPPADADEIAVHTYLWYLHHRRARARIAGDAELEADLARQTADFKYGNPLWQQMFTAYFDYYWQYPYHEGGSPQYRSWQARWCDEVTTHRRST